MYFSTNKEKGNTSLGVAIAFFTSHGYTVSIPLKAQLIKLLKILP